MRSFCLALAVMLSTTAAAAQEMPSAARLKADDEKLVSFGTRHTLSDANDPKRGIGAARRWFQGELDKISKQCGNCIQTSMIERVFTNERAPKGVNIVDVLGIQPGTDPNRVVIVMGHIDSRVTDVMNATADAPGANDDGSGTVLVLEAARILSKEKFNATIVYAALSGEEQGLMGGKLLADTAKQRGWTVTAALNNDIVGNTVGTDGTVVADRVRVFSEGIEASAPIETQLARRASGSEDDSPSRALAKTIRSVATTIPGGLEGARRASSGPLRPRWRPLAIPRTGLSRGAFLGRRRKLRCPASGSAPRLRRHARQDGFPLSGQGDGDQRRHVAPPRQRARGARNGVAGPGLCRCRAGPEQFRPGCDRAKIDWKPVAGATGYRIYWRRADKFEWTDHVDVAGGDTAQTIVKGVIVDDNFLGVSALGTNGSKASSPSVEYRRAARAKSDQVEA